MDRFEHDAPPQPSRPPSALETDERRYWIRRRGRVSGPFDRYAIERQLRSRRLSRLDELSLDGVHWKPLHTAWPPAPIAANRHASSTKPAMREQPREAVVASDPAPATPREAPRNEATFRVVFVGAGALTLATLLLPRGATNEALVWWWTDASGSWALLPLSITLMTLALAVWAIGIGVHSPPPCTRRTLRWVAALALACLVFTEIVDHAGPGALRAIGVLGLLAGHSIWRRWLGAFPEGEPDRWSDPALRASAFGLAAAFVITAAALWEAHRSPSSARWAWLASWRFAVTGASWIGALSVPIPQPEDPCRRDAAAGLAPEITGRSSEPTVEERNTP